MDVSELSVTAELLQRSESADAEQAKQTQAGAATGQADIESLSQVGGAFDCSPNRRQADTGLPLPAQNAL